MADSSSNYSFGGYVKFDAMFSDYSDGDLAPGSAGTLAAGDYVKSIWRDSKIVALEPRQCSTLYDGGQGFGPMREQGLARGVALFDPHARR